MGAEIVLVDNASTDDTQDVVKEWAANASVPLRLVYEACAGLSAARNCGISVACGELVVFTDDDCRLSPTYVAELLRYDAADGDELVMRSGSVVLGSPDDLPITIKPVAAKRRWKKPMSLLDEAQLLGGALIGCNMVMRRIVPERLGRFDEDFGAGTVRPAGEDTDYFYRAYLSGITLEIVPDLIVHHFHGRRTLEERTKLLRNYAIGNGALSFKYLFIYPRFSRHLLWAAKSAVKSALHSNKQGAWISPFDNFFYMLVGVYRYTWKMLARRFGVSG